MICFGRFVFGHYLCRREKQIQRLVWEITITATDTLWRSNLGSDTGTQYILYFVFWYRPKPTANLLFLKKQNEKTKSHGNVVFVFTFNLATFSKSVPKQFSRERAQAWFFPIQWAPVQLGHKTDQNSQSKLTLTTVFTLTQFLLTVLVYWLLSLVLVAANFSYQMLWISPVVMWWWLWLIVKLGKGGIPGQRCRCPKLVS